MGRRPNRSLGASASCGRVVVVVFIVCIALLVVMVATTSAAGVSLGPARAGGVTKTSSPVRKSGGGQAGEDAYRSSKRRIPKGPDPIHNRRAGKTTIAPRRRD